MIPLNDRKEVALYAQPEFSSRLIIEEPPLQVLPSLAVKIGLNEAIVVQQLHYLLRNPKFGKRIEEFQWIFNTYEEWKVNFFPFWSVDTIKRIFTALSRNRLVICCQPEGRLSRRKYYRLDYAKLSEISEQGKLPSSNGAKWPLPITKTTYKESKESKETSAEADAISDSEFPAQWKPDSRTKQQKLKAIRPPRDYPSEREFDFFLSSTECSGIEAYRSDLYSELCDHKWHQWKEDIGKWIRIRDWKQYVTALDHKISARL